MIVDTAHNLGDIAWCLRTSKVARKAPCRACDDTGRIDVPQTERGWVRCPDCGGYTRQGEVVAEVDAYEVEGPLTIGMVRVSVTAAGEQDECYMAFETGVGSGTVYPVERLFPSREAAVAHAEALGMMPMAEALRAVRPEGRAS